MASTSVEKEIKSENGLDSLLMNKLLYSLGRLKFSMRTLGTMNHQMAMHPTEETEINSDSDFIQSLESNKIMENIMKEFLIRKTDPNENKMDTQDFSKEVSPVEDLEFIYEKLNNELSAIRSHYQSVFSEQL